MRCATQIIFEDSLSTAGKTPMYHNFLEHKSDVKQTSKANRLIRLKKQKGGGRLTFVWDIRDCLKVRSYQADLGHWRDAQQDLRASY